MIHSRLIAPLTSAVEKTKANLLLDLNNLSKEPAKEKRERLEYMNRMSLSIANDPNEEETSGVPEDYDERGIIASITQLDLISSVLSRLVEIMQLP